MVYTLSPTSISSTTLTSFGITNVPITIQSTYCFTFILNPTTVMVLEKYFKYNLNHSNQSNCLSNSSYRKREYCFSINLYLYHAANHNRKYIDSGINTYLYWIYLMRCVLIYPPILYAFRSNCSRVGIDGGI